MISSSQQRVEARGGWGFSALSTPPPPGGGPLRASQTDARAARSPKQAGIRDSTMGFSLMEEPIDIVGRRSTGSLLARREWSDQGLSSGTRTPTSTDSVPTLG